LNYILRFIDCASLIKIFLNYHLTMNNAWGIS
jgi:hypothetical protein